MNPIKFPYANEVPRQYEWLSHDEECEVLVLGGSVAGCLATYMLAQSGVNVVLLTKHPVGFGACESELTSACSAGELMLTSLSRFVGRENAISCFYRCNSALDKLEELSEQISDFGFVRRDSFVYTDSVEGINSLHAEYLMRRHNGFAATFLEQTEASELFSFPVKAGLLMKDAGAELDAYRLCHSLLEAATEAGARVYENSPAYDLVETQGGVVAKTPLCQTVQAKKLVLAIGNKQDEYLHALSTRRRIFYVSTKPLTRFSGYENRALVRNITSDVSLRTTGNDSVIIGGLSCGAFEHENKLSELLGGERISARKYAELTRILESMLCGVDTLKGEHCYNGVYGITKDGLPVFGASAKYQNTYFDMPASKSSILYSVIGAETIRDAYTEGVTDMLFSPDRKSL